MRLCPFGEFFQTKARQGIVTRAARYFVTSGKTVIVLDQTGQPRRRAETGIWAIWYCFQKPLAYVRPVVLSPPASLRPKNTLQDGAPVANIQGLVERSIHPVVALSASTIAVRPSVAN